MNMSRTVALTSFFVLLTLIAGPAMALDPCAFITPEEAAAILGEAVKPARSGKTTGFAVGSSCAYYTAAPLAERGGVGSLSLVVYDAETMQAEESLYTSPAEYFRRLRKANESSAGSKTEALDGLGEESYWQGGADQLHLLAGGLYLVLSVKDLVKIASDKGRDDLDAKVSAHRLEKCREAARAYLLPKLK
jgi:hypothetical protein